MKTYVLDASALITFFEDRAGAEKVEELLRRAAEEQQFLLLSVLNWGEVYYAFWQTHGEHVANQKLHQIAQLPIEPVDVDITTTKIAASMKANVKLPYVDCFVAALAQQRKAIVVTSDKDFVKVEKQVNILWAKNH